MATSKLKKWAAGAALGLALVAGSANIASTSETEETAGVQSNIDDVDPVTGMLFCWTGALACWAAYRWCSNALKEPTFKVNLDREPENVMGDY